MGRAKNPTITFTGVDFVLKVTLAFPEEGNILFLTQPLPQAPHIHTL